MTTKIAKEIPISEAKKICNDYGYDELIIFGANYNQPMQHVTTWGVNKQACENAGLGGDFIKKHLNWEDGLSKYTIQHNQQIKDRDDILKDLIDCTNNPDKDMVITLANFVRVGVRADKLLKEKCASVEPNTIEIETPEQKIKRLENLLIQEVKIRCWRQAEGTGLSTNKLEEYTDKEIKEFCEKHNINQTS